jgi:hypothetical protein
MKKVIQLTESDLTNIVKRVIKENAAKDSLIDMIKYDGWKSAAELVGGVKNLKNLTGIGTPMEFLNLFNDLDVVQSKQEPHLTLYRYEEGNNIMIYDRKNGDVYINNNKIWSFLKEGFGLNHSEIQEITEEWLSEVYNLRGVTTQSREEAILKMVV